MTVEDRDNNHYYHWTKSTIGNEKNIYGVTFKIRRLLSYPAKLDVLLNVKVYNVSTMYSCLVIRIKHLFLKMFAWIYTFAQPCMYIGDIYQRHNIMNQHHGILHLPISNS